MATDIETRPDISDLVELDEKRCTVRSYRTYLFGRIERHEGQCPRGARWIGHTPCCGEPWYACDEHRDNGLPYACCGRSWPTQALGWRPI